MKIYKKEINGISVSAYNDSGCQWVVSGGNLNTMRFEKAQFSMKHAMQFYADLCSFKTV